MSAPFKEGCCGAWKIEPFTVPEGDIETLRSMWKGRHLPAGDYWRLIHKTRGVVMSNTPAELMDLYEFRFQLKQYVKAGTLPTILIHGLGLGCAVDAAIEIGCSSIDVLEIDPDVISLSGYRFRYESSVAIHPGDALTFKWSRGKRWNVVWHDIWDDICLDNLPEMHKLHRRFGGRCDWQASWARDECHA